VNQFLLKLWVTNGKKFSVWLEHILSEESLPGQHLVFISNVTPDRWTVSLYPGSQMVVKKVKGFSCSSPSVVPGADPLVYIHPVVGCHCFLPGLRLPSQLHSITAPWPVPSYNAWWQRHTGVNNLPKVVTQLLPQVGFWTDDLLTASPMLYPLRHRYGSIQFKIQTTVLNL